MKDENLEKRKDFLRSLTQKDRDYIGKYGFDMFHKKQKLELEAENAEKDAELKEKEIQESQKVVPIEISSSEIHGYNAEILNAQRKLENLNREIVSAKLFLEGSEIREAKDILKGLKYEITNASSRLEQLKLEFSQNMEFQEMLRKVKKKKRAKNKWQ